MAERRGRIRQNLTDWQKVLKKIPNMNVLPWHLAIPEFLHIAIALIDYPFEKVTNDFLLFCKTIEEEQKNDFYGNLSASYELIKNDKLQIEKINDNVIYLSLIKLLEFYNDLFQVKGLDTSEELLEKILECYYKLLGRKSDFSIQCKFIFINNIYDGNVEPFLHRKISKLDEVLEPINKSIITSAWVIMADSKEIINHELSQLIWLFNYHYLPVEQLDDTLNQEKDFKKFNIGELRAEFQVISTELKSINLLLVWDRYVAEIIMGFINRTIYLTLETVELVELHKGEIAEAVLRLLYECRLKFLWLVEKNDNELLQRFREYSSGREKLFLDKYSEKADPKNIKKLKSFVDKTLEDEGLENHEVAIERGDVFEKGIDKLASDLGDNERYLYDVIYKRTSDIIHGNWRILTKYHLVRSGNPMHNKLLDYNEIDNKFCGMLPALTSLMLGSQAILKILRVINKSSDEHSDLLKRTEEFYEKVSEELMYKYIPYSIKE
ncbi:MAG: hypothetical protein IMY72_04115 [Bacteroidetes bacterium]|nr:hypothetical protein [Bacteroidota bacterium]